MFFVESPQGDEVARADTFEEALVHATDEYGKNGDYAISWGVDGSRSERRRVAYHSFYDSFRREIKHMAGAVSIRVVEPAYLPAYLQPGNEIDLDIDRRRYTFFMNLAPESETYPFAMEMAGPHGGRYPQPIERYVSNFANASWKNDVADSIVFSIGDKGYVVWIQPTSFLARTDEMEPSQYVMYELVDIDTANEEPMELREVLAEKIPNQDKESFEIEDPAELLRVIAELAQTEDPAAMRAAKLELGPARGRRASDRSDDLYERAKLIRQELQDEDLELNPRGRARKNPSDDDQQEQLRLAKEKFEEFHRHEPRKVFDRQTPMPTRVRELGDSLFVLYASKKHDPDTGLPVKDAVRYIHEHDSAGVTTYTPVKSGGVAVPSWLVETTSVVLLGKCLGYAWKDPQTGKERESKIRPAPELYTTPCGRALLVIQDRREVIAMVWGGALGVEARGIVG